MAKFTIGKADDMKLERHSIKYNQYVPTQQHIFYQEDASAEDDKNHFQLISNDLSLIRALFFQHEVKSIPKSFYSTCLREKQIITKEKNMPKFTVLNDKMDEFLHYIEPIYSQANYKNLRFVCRAPNPHALDDIYSYEELNDGDSFEIAYKNDAVIYAVDAKIFDSLSKKYPRKSEAAKNVIAESKTEDSIKNRIASKTETSVYSYSYQNSTAPIIVSPVSKIPTHTEENEKPKSKFFCCFPWAKKNTPEKDDMKKRLVELSSSESYYTASPVRKDS